LPLDRDWERKNVNTEATESGRALRPGNPKFADIVISIPEKEIPMRAARATSVVAALSILALIASAAVATQGPGIEMKEVAKISGGVFSGMTGWMARRAGMPDEVETKTFVNADATKKRIDALEESTIVDLENELYITLDHDDKTAVVKTFDQLRAEFEAMMEEYGGTGGIAKEDQGPGEETERASEPPKMSFAVEPTGRRFKHRDFNVEEYYQTVSLESSEPDGGTMVLFSILYMTDEIDLSTLERFDRAFAEAMGDAVYAAGQTKLSMEAMLDDPEMQGALAGARDAGDQLGDRVAVYTKTYMVSVPAGMKFNRELAMSEEKKEGGGFGGFMRRAAGVADPDGEPDAEDQEAPVEQQTTFEFENECRDFKHKNPKDDKFEVPGRYKIEES
jgi:hypothetical protein